MKSAPTPSGRRSGWGGHAFWWSQWRVWDRWWGRRGPSPGRRLRHAAWWVSWRAARSLPGLPVNGALLLASSLLALLLFEAVVRLPGVPLPPRLGRYLFSCYEPTNPARYIYARSQLLELDVHRPNLTRRCWFGGRWWTHQTDAFGGRNPETWQRVEVALLGDSFIYGHGVDGDETVASQLAEITGWRVTNLGITGGSPVQYLPLLVHFALPLRPRVAVVFIFANDLEDIASYLSPEEQRRFVRQGRAPLARSREQAMAELEPLPPWWSRWPHLAASFRLGHWLHEGRGWPQLWAARRRPRLPWIAAGPGLELPTEVAAEATPAGVGMAPFTRPGRTRADGEGSTHASEAQVLRRAFQLMAAEARAAGSELVIGYIPGAPGRQGPFAGRAGQLRELLVRTAAENQLTLIDALEVVWSRERGLLREYRLAGDGHLSPAGHARLAELLAEDLAEVVTGR